MDSEDGWWRLGGNRLIGKRIIHLEEATSTNDVAKELARRGAEEGLVVIAETQSRGRGRLGSAWASPRGGIWLSVLLRPKVAPINAACITIAAAVSVAEAVEEVLGVKPQVKWPNDLLIDGRKFCGILAESSVRGERLDFVVLGIGVNANVKLEELPEELRDSATTLYSALGRPIPRRRLLDAILRRLELHYSALLQGRFPEVLERWKALDITIGRRVVAEGPGGRIAGKVLDVDGDGSLIVQVDGGSAVRLRAGEVHILEM